MAKQRPWDQHEAIILLEATISVHEGRIDRKRAIKDVSKALRNKAHHEGEVIDSVFRNEAGITFQMYSMESAYLGYVVRKKPATKLFKEVVYLRVNDRTKYDALLEEAFEMTTDIGNRSAFQNWLIRNGMKDTAARNYVSRLNSIDAYVINHDYSKQSVYEYDSIEKLTILYDLLTSNDDFLAVYKAYLVALKKYILFKSNGTADDEEKRPGFSTEAKTYIPTIDAESPKMAFEAYKQERYSKILKDYFQEGLVINAIRLDKFRMLYEAEFDDTLTRDDDELANQLKAVGTLIDGRIYPRQNEDHNGVLNEIRKTIVKVLNEGASCVYISSVMSRWQQPLAEQLKVYNTIALRDLIMSSEMPGIYATNTLFKLTSQKVNPENDVLSFMKKCHTPICYGRLQESLWYIPMEVIKHALVMTPSLVQVDWETYMYAPNFPASSNELQKLIKEMKTKIEEKGFLVSKDIAWIITNRCPTIAINTEGYKDWAYRNILKYLFKDQFEFGSSVVSKKGQKLEMWQVYRSFCRDYERLTINELKSFSGEVGVQIYWTDVLSEMVRINQKEMIRKDKIHFEIDYTDNILDKLCLGDYLPIQQVGLFLHFPPIGYPWNSYVLESYLQFSKRFVLYHVSYSENGVYGVIVRRSSEFSDYRQVIVDMLAKSNEWSNAQEALTLIVEKGYQARKRWTGFENVVQEALVRREKTLLEKGGAY